jgi:hypothetical protein
LLHPAFAVPPPGSGASIPVAGGSGLHLAASGTSGARPALAPVPPKSSPAVRVPLEEPEVDIEVAEEDDAAVVEVEEAEGEHLVRRLKVIDGADHGHSFLLNDNGVTTVGSSSKHAEVCLHDLYVGRVHCQLEPEGDHLIVTACEETKPTYINGQQIRRHPLAPGDVLRVGNSYLRLELEVATAGEAAPARPSAPGVAAPHGAAAPPKIPQLPLNRLGELAGYTIGHFQLDKALGAGFHGVVFRARDLKSDQDVALKVFAPEFPANDAEMQHFVQAMRSAVPLRHAGLVTVYSAGRSGSYCWLSRELVQGVSLAQLLHPSGKAREGIDWRLALRVAVHISQALEVVHHHHMMHGNVTPHNILLEGNDGQAKLNDLMLRKGLEGSQLAQSVMEKKFLAELPYLAPEQTDPDAFVDNLSDVYSLGVVVYALMTGKLPFRGKTPEELLEEIRNTIPAKPKKFERSIPNFFQEVVLKMLSKRQEDRYDTPAALLADLDQIAKERDVSV